MSDFANVCTKCHHLASRHYLVPGADVVGGPYACSHKDCDCRISQRTALTGITEREFNQTFAPTLGEYEDPR